MQISLTPDTTLAQLSDQLSSKFHNLKLVFFTKPHERYKGSNAKFIISDRDTLLKDCSNVVSQNSTIELDGKMKTYELEELLEVKFELHVQVFRKTATTWIETSTTDGRTLDEQNHQAEAEAYYNATLQDEHLDYREQD